MARFYTTSKGEFLKPFDPSDYGYAGTAKTTGSGTRSTAAPKLGDFEVLPQDVNALDSRMTDYQKRINDLTYQVMKDPKSIKALTPEMQKLSLEIGSDVRAGDIYHMLNRKSEYDRIVKNLEEVFGDRRDLLEGAINAIEIPSLINENGEYQQIRAPRVTDPWTSAREGALFKDAIAVLKPKLQDSTDWQNVPAVSDEVTKYFEKEDIYGLNAKDIENTIISQLSPQDLLAITQEAELMGMDPERVMKNFETRIRNFANSIAGVTDKKQKQTTLTDYGLQAKVKANAAAEVANQKGQNWFADRLTKLYVDFESIDPKEFGDFMPDNVTREELKALAPLLPILGRTITPEIVQQYNLTPRQIEIIQGAKEYLNQNISNNLKDLTEAFKDTAFEENDNYIIQSFNYNPNAAPGEEVTITYRTTPEEGDNGSDDPEKRDRGQGAQAAQGEVVTKPVTLGLLRRILGQKELDKIYTILDSRGMVAEGRETIIWKAGEQVDAGNAGPQIAPEDSATSTETTLPEGATWGYDPNKADEKTNPNGAFLSYKELNPNFENLGYVGEPFVDPETKETSYRYYISEEDASEISTAYKGINPLDPKVNLVEQVQRQTNEDFDQIQETYEKEKEIIATRDQQIAEIDMNQTYEDENGNTYSAQEYKESLEKDKAERLKKQEEREAVLNGGREKALEEIKNRIGPEANNRRIEEAKQRALGKYATNPGDSVIVEEVYDGRDFSGDFLKSQNEDSKIPEDIKKNYPTAKDIPGYTFYGHILADKKEEEIASMGGNWNKMLSDTENYRIVDDGKGGHFIYVKTQNTNQ